MPLDSRKGPATNGALSSNLSKPTITQVSHDHTVRCRHCDRPLHAFRSVTRCSGPTCWRRTHQAAIA
jgi:hypothetical protein